MSAPSGISIAYSCGCIIYNKTGRNAVWRYAVCTTHKNNGPVIVAGRAIITAFKNFQLVSVNQS